MMGNSWKSVLKRKAFGKASWFSNIQSGCSDMIPPCIASDRKKNFDVDGRKWDKARLSHFPVLKVIYSMSLILSSSLLRGLRNLDCGGSTHGI